MSEADSFLRAYAGTVGESAELVVVQPESATVVLDTSLSRTAGEAVPAGEAMPDTIPASPKKRGFWNSLFSKSSGLASSGGLGAALLVMIILYLAIVPVSSGSTRLELLWATLRGKTVLNPSAPGPSKALQAFAQSALVGAETQIGSIELGLKTNVIDLEKWIGGL